MTRVTHVLRSDETRLSQPSHTHVDSIGDLGSTDRKGELASVSLGDGMFGKANLVGVRRKAALVGVGEQRVASGTGDSLTRFGGGTTCCVCCWWCDR